MTARSVHSTLGRVMLRVHIEPKSRLGDAHVAELERALRGARASGRELTVGDAAEVSGLPLDLAEQALMALAHRFPSRIRVTEEGELLFRFAALSTPPGPSAWARVGRRLRGFAEKPLALLLLFLCPFLLGALTGNLVGLVLCTIGETMGFLLAIPAGLIATFSALASTMTLLVFIVLPISGLMMMVGGVGVAAVIFDDASPTAVAVLFGLAFAAFCLYLGARLAWAGFKTLHDLVVRDTSWVGRLLARSRDFVFGPPPRAVDALADERRLVSVLRARDGVVCVSDLIALFGWTPAEADLELARVLSDYGGDVHVTDDGALVYVFDALLVSTAGADAPAPPPDDRPISRPGATAPRFFGADGWLVLTAVGLAALGVALNPMLRLFPDAAHYHALYVAHPHEPWPILQGVGITPWLVVLAVPALRLPFHLARVLRARFERRLLPLLEVAARHPGGAQVPRVRANLLADLGATTLDDGRVAFPQLAAAVAAAAELRRTRRTRRDPGEVVFSSDPSERVPG